MNIMVELRQIIKYVGFKGKNQNSILCIQSRAKRLNNHQHHDETTVLEGPSSLANNSSRKCHLILQMIN